MSKEKNKALDLINAEIEEKTSTIQGLAEKLQQAKNFITQNDPILIGLDGAIKQLRHLKTLLLGKEDETPMKEPQNEDSDKKSEDKADKSVEKK